MTEQAALDENMPPIEEAQATAEATEIETESPAESAPATVDDGFVETDNDAVQARINKITAEKYAKMRENEALAAENERLKAQAVKPVQTDSSEPKLEDFDFDEAAHTAALIDYKVSQGVEKKAKEIQQDQQQQATANAQQKIQADFITKEAAFIEKVTDYDDVVKNIPQLNQETLNAVMQQDNGPELAYYLGKHLDVADTVSQLSPAAAGFKLGQISAQLSAQTQTIETSAAPEPISTVTSSGTLGKSQEDMTMEEIYSL